MRECLREWKESTDICLCWWDARLFLVFGWCLCSYLALFVFLALFWILHIRRDLALFLILSRSWTSPFPTWTRGSASISRGFWCLRFRWRRQFFLPFGFRRYCRCRGRVGSFICRWCLWFWVPCCRRGRRLWGFWFTFGLRISRCLSKGGCTGSNVVAGFGEVSFPLPTKHKSHC